MGRWLKIRAIRVFRSILFYFLSIDSNCWDRLKNIFINVIVKFLCDVKILTVVITF